MAYTPSGGSGDLGFGMTFTLVDNFSAVADKIQNRFNSFATAAQTFANSTNASIGSVATQTQTAFNTVGNSFNTTALPISDFSKNMSELKSGIFEVTEAFAILSPVIKGLEWAAKFETIDIRLKTLLGSASEAKRVFDNLKADEPYMPFNIETLLNGNTALIAAGASADYARSSVKSLANAVAATGGSTAQMNSALLNLQKIYETGKADKRHLYAFSYGAHIPMMELLARSTGKTTEQLSEMKITFNDIITALGKAQEKGGMFENALFNMSQTITGKLTTLKTQVMFFFANIGDATKGTFHAIINLGITLLSTINAILSTPIGKFFAGIAQGALILISLSLAFHGAGRAFGALVSMAGGGGQTIFTMIKSFLAATSGWIIALVALAFIFETINKAMNAWAMASSEVGTSFTKFEKFGGFLTAMFAIWNGMDDSFQFNMPEEMYNKLKNAGILETVQNLATWLVRIKVFLSGVAEGFMYVFDTIKYVFNAAIGFIGDVFGLFGINIEKATDALSLWKAWGIITGVVLFATAVYVTWAWIAAAYAIGAVAIKAFGGWFLRMGALLATGIASAFGLGIAFDSSGVLIAAAGEVAFIGWLPLLAIPLLIIAAIALIVYAIYELYTHFDQVKKWFIDMGETIYVAGTYFVNSFLDGIKSAWHSVIDFFSNAWNTLPEWIRKPLEVGFNLYNAPVGAASDLLFGTDYLSQNNNVKTIQTATQQAAPQMMYSGGGGQQDNNKPIILHTNVHLDGNQIGSSVQQYNTRQEQRASHGDR